MPTCHICKHQFRTPKGEEQDHECPHCGWAPWLAEEYDPEEYEEED